MSIDDTLTEVVDAAVRQAVADVLADLADRPLVLTVSQVASLLQVSDRMVEHMVADGTLPKLAGVGRRVLIPRLALEAFVNGALA